jgi:tetratricopeptide (TPR) repeat protein
VEAVRTANGDRISGGHRLYRRRVELEPLNGSDRNTLAVLYAFARRFEESDRAFARAVEVDPQNDRTLNALLAGRFGPGYTSGMKTAISLPDAVFRDAERLAKRLKKSRSKLYMEAVAEYVARHEPEAITEALNRLAVRPDARAHEFTSAAARHVLEHSEW